MANKPITLQELEDMTHSKYVRSEMIEIKDSEFFKDNGQAHRMSFDIFDGLAYCKGYKGDEYVMEYPRIGLIDKAPNMQKKIRDFLGMDEKQKIEIPDILHAYGVLSKV